MSEYFNGEFFFNIALHVTFLFLFLSIFFLGYAKNIESRAINNEINHIINNAFSGVVTNNNNTTIKKIYNKLPKKNIDYFFNYYTQFFSLDDPERKALNNELTKNIIHINVLLIIILIFFVIVLLTTNSITIGEIGHVVLENFLTFILIGIVEYVFFSQVALNYVPSLPSDLYKGILSNLQSNFTFYSNN